LVNAFQDHWGLLTPGPALSPPGQARLRYSFPQSAPDVSPSQVSELIVIDIIEPSGQSYWRSGPKHRFQHTPGYCCLTARDFFVAKKNEIAGLMRATGKDLHQLISWE